MSTRVGIAGVGAIGSAVARALQDGIPGFTLEAVSDPSPIEPFDVPHVSFESLAERCDLIVEALPPAIVPALAQEVFKHHKPLILISSSALLLFPGILDHQQASDSRIIVPSGALCGIDGVNALVQIGIKHAKISTTKPPHGYGNAPYVEEQSIDLSSITERRCLFQGNALEAAAGFPANVNVAATLSLAGIGPEKTQVEIWADPDVITNRHDIEVVGEFSTIRTCVENTPDPANPKSSMLTAQSIVAVLKGMNAPLVVL